jgi:hypothetical protein
VLEIGDPIGEVGVPAWRQDGCAWRDLGRRWLDHRARPRRGGETRVERGAEHAGRETGEDRSQVPTHQLG